MREDGRRSEAAAAAAISAEVAGMSLVSTGSTGSEQWGMTSKSLRKKGKIEG